MRARASRASIAISVSSIERSTSARRRQRRRWLRCLLFSSVGAAIFGLAGLGLSAVSLLHFAPSNGVLSTIATILLTVAFLLLFLVSHCLDQLASFDRETREEIYREKLRRILSK